MAETMQVSAQRAWTHLKKYQPLIHELVSRDLKVKYRRSFLGYIWSILNPLLMMLLQSIIFSYMFRNDIPNFPLYLICGNTLFTFFNETTSMGLTSVIQNAPLIKKVYIPKFIFPISQAVSRFVTMLFSGGIVPTYMVMNTLGLTGSRLSIILLEATQTFYLIFAAKAFAAVPLSTVEAARIDGAGHLRVMFQIMLPQAKGMFFITLLNTFVGAWNSWYNASIYVTADKTKWPIQLFINEMTSANVNFLETATPNYSRYLIQFAVIVVATLPIMVAMPFFQVKIEAGQLQGGVNGLS